MADRDRDDVVLEGVGNDPNMQLVIRCIQQEFPVSADTARTLVDQIVDELIGSRQVRQHHALLNPKGLYVKLCSNV